MSARADQIQKTERKEKTARTPSVVGAEGASFIITDNRAYTRNQNQLKTRIQKKSGESTTGALKGKIQGKNPIQRIVAFTVETQGKTAGGFTGTNRFKNELSSGQQAVFRQMHNRQNKQHTFQNADSAFNYLSSDGATDQPVVSKLVRGQLQDTFNQVAQGEAFKATGASKYLKYTQFDMNNWARFTLLHKNTAISLVPTDKEHHETRQRILQLYNEGMVAAGQLDDHESIESLETEGGELKELKAPRIVKEKIQAMYAEAKKARNDLSRPVPSIAVPRFGPVNANGLGSWAYIDFSIGDSFPEGSSASGTYTSLPWEGRLKNRRTPAGGNVYIRGHLLNDHLGGHSASYNLVPLVGTDVPGAPNENATHSAQIEGQARNAFKTMSREDNDGSNSPTQNLYTGLRYFVGVSAYGVPSLKDFILNLVYEQFLIDVDLGLASLRLQKSEGSITMGEFKRFLGAGSVNLLEQKQYQTKWTNRYKNILRIVCDTDKNDSLVKDALVLLGRNTDLWNWEAENLPASLTCRFYVKTPFGQEVESGTTATIPAGPVKNPYMKYKE